jgi:hypothetical protein
MAQTLDRECHQIYGEQEQNLYAGFCARGAGEVLLLWIKGAPLVGSCLQDSKRTSSEGRGASDVSDDTTQFDGKKVLSCPKLWCSREPPRFVEHECSRTSFLTY